MPAPPVRGPRSASGAEFWSATRSNIRFLLYAGNIRPQKNIPRLVEAFAVVRNELASHPLYADLRLIIIGDQIARNPAVRRAVIHSRVENCARFPWLRALRYPAYFL